METKISPLTGNRKRKPAAEPPVLSDEEADFTGSSSADGAGDSADEFPVVKRKKSKKEKKEKKRAKKAAKKEKKEKEKLRKKKEKSGKTGISGSAAAAENPEPDDDDELFNFFENINAEDVLLEKMKKKNEARLKRHKEIEADKNKHH